MRILIAADYFLADMGYPKISLAKAWQHQGHTVRVITSNRYFPFHNYKYSVQKLIGSRFRKVGIKKENTILVERRPALFEIFARVMYSGIAARVNSFKPDIVVVFGITSWTALFLAALKKHNCPHLTLIMVDSHLPSELELGNQFLKNTFYFLFRKICSSIVDEQTNMFVATQDKTIPIISNVYGIKKRIELIPNGTDSILFKKNLTWRNKIRKELGINSTDNVLIYTGKVIPEKGVAILCKSFALVSKRYPTTRLLIVGEGSEEYKQECMASVKDSLRDSLFWIGAKPHHELPQYYSAADIAIWPLQESLAMNDAASCELPFIANHTMGDKTRISNNNALLYKKGDHRDLAKKIETLFRDKKLRTSMGKRGRQLITKRLSWNKLAQYYLK